MNDVIKKITSDLEEQFQRVLQDGIDKASRIADLERQLAEASAQAVGRLVSIDEMCKTLDAALIKSTERTDCTILYTVTFDQLRDLYMKGMASAPSALAVEPQPVNGWVEGDTFTYLNDDQKTVWQSGIHVPDHWQAIVCYGSTEADARKKRDAILRAVATPQAADTDKVREVWKHDAESFGNALNEACWTFTESAPEGSISAMLWNHLKPTLRTAILKYSELVSASMAAQAPVREVPGWKPIEAAPKDGSEVLLWLPAPYSRIAKARWFDLWENWQEGEFPSDQDEYSGIGCQLPTHYMPLPAAPVQQEPKP